MTGYATWINCLSGYPNLPYSDVESYYLISLSIYLVKIFRSVIFFVWGCTTASVGFVLDAKLQLVMDGFSVVWTLFGTPSASGVMLAIDQYQSMRYKIENVPDITSFNITR